MVVLLLSGMVSFAGDKNQALIDAVLQVNSAKVRKLLGTGAEANATTEEGDPVLNMAVGKGNLEIIQLLIAKGADLNKADPDGRTPLMLACMGGDERLISILLNKGAKADLTDKFDKTALFFAVDSHSKRVVEIIQDLLRQGAELNLQDFEGITPLMIAAANGDANALKTLLSKGADTKIGESKDGETALIRAIDAGKTESVKILLDQGADPNLRDKRNRTPLGHAKYLGYEAMVELLLKAGANPEPY